MAVLMFLVWGVGIFLVDFGTDVKFSVDMHNMAVRNISGEIGDCRTRLALVSDGVIIEALAEVFLD